MREQSGIMSINQTILTKKGEEMITHSAAKHSFWEGFLSAFTIIPQKKRRRSTEEAIGQYWINVGRDIETAISKEEILRGKKVKSGDAEYKTFIEHRGNHLLVTICNEELKTNVAEFEIEGVLLNDQIISEIVRRVISLNDAKQEQKTESENSQEGAALACTR